MTKPTVESTLARIATSLSDIAVVLERIDDALSGPPYGYEYEMIEPEDIHVYILEGWKVYSVTVEQASQWQETAAHVYHVRRPLTSVQVFGVEEEVIPVPDDLKQIPF